MLVSRREVELKHKHTSNLKFTSLPWYGARIDHFYVPEVYLKRIAKIWFSQTVSKENQITDWCCVHVCASLTSVILKWSLVSMLYFSILSLISSLLSSVRNSRSFSTSLNNGRINGKHDMISHKSGKKTRTIQSLFRRVTPEAKKTFLMIKIKKTSMSQSNGPLCFLAKTVKRKYTVYASRVCKVLLRMESNVLLSVKVNWNDQLFYKIKSCWLFLEKNDNMSLKKQNKQPVVYVLYPIECSILVFPAHSRDEENFWDNSCVSVWSVSKVKLIYSKVCFFFFILCIHSFPKITLKCVWRCLTAGGSAQDKNNFLYQSHAKRLIATFSHEVAPGGICKCTRITFETI